MSRSSITKKFAWRVVTKNVTVFCQKSSEFLIKDSLQFLKVFDFQCPKYAIAYIPPKFLHKLQHIFLCIFPQWNVTPFPKIQGSQVGSFITTTKGLLPTFFIYFSGELTLMQTSSSSNESRNNESQKFCKVVASYSNSAIAQKPIFPGDDKKNNVKSQNNHNSSSCNINQKSMITSVTSSGKSSTSPLSEGEGKVSAISFSRKISFDSNTNVNIIIKIKALFGSACQQKYEKLPFRRESSWREKCRKKQLVKEVLAHWKFTVFSLLKL